MIPALLLTMAALATPAALTGCNVTDGDTIRCGDERIRLTGIDAPEMGKCRKGRACVPGDGPASKATLQRAVAGQPLTIIRLGHDRYGRTLAVVYAGSLNLACHQIAHGGAVYKPQWDDGGIVGRECG